MPSEFMKPTASPEDKKFFSDKGTQTAAGNWPAYQAKQQAAMVALMKGGQVDTDFDKTLNNLTQGGEDPDVDSFRADKLRDLAAVDDEVAQAIVTAEHTTPADKIQLVENLTASAATRPVPPLKGIYLEEQALNASVQQPQEERTHLNLMES
ncbi:MAG: hypothetical protein KAS32_10910, partial [Candidatus Peribacteraceae bacterium]|nr:hypothetical protein [Candidatus Peribacteraceae bacterium]